MVGFRLGERGGRGKGGGGWLVLGWVGASLFNGPLKLWSTSSRLMSSRSVVARWRPPGKRFTFGSEAGERGGESLEVRMKGKKFHFTLIHLLNYFTMNTLKKKIPPEGAVKMLRDWLNILFNKQMTAFNIQLMVQSPCFCSMQMNKPMPPCSLLLGCCAFKAVYVFFNQYKKRLHVKLHSNRGGLTPYLGGFILHTRDLLQSCLT